MRLTSLAMLPLFAVACGGSTSTDLFTDASSTDDSSTTNDSGTGTDSGVRDARPDAPTPAQCNKLIADVADLRDKARQCSPNGGEQCGVSVNDLCCPISVTNLQSKDVQDFVAAVDAVKKAGCNVACPAVPCVVTPSKTCDAKTGRCL